MVKLITNTRLSILGEGIDFYSSVNEVIYSEDKNEDVKVLILAVV